VKTFYFLITTLLIDQRSRILFETLENIDQSLFLHLNDVHAPWLDVVMWYVSWTATWIPLFVFFLWYAYKRGGAKFMFTLLVSAAICVALTDLISVHGFKETVQRYRPTHNTEIGHLVKTVVKPNGEEYRGGIYSFVSSHAANFGGITILIFLFFRRFSKAWYLLFPWLILIAYSRIYLGVHYPSDLIAGGLLGALIGLLIYSLVKKFIFPKLVLKT
jgi:undecaprenyl-diphosphatase